MTNDQFIISSSSYQLPEINRQRQGGKFTIQSLEKSLIPLNEQPEYKNRLACFLISPETKKELRPYLDQKLNLKRNPVIKTPGAIDEIVNDLKLNYGLK